MQCVFFEIFSNFLFQAWQVDGAFYSAMNEVIEIT